MSRLDPPELSGFLDGELSLERMREIEEILASEPIARAELSSLTADDIAWRAAARAAAFRPKVSLRLTRESAIVIGSAALFLALLLIAQSLMRWFDVLNFMLLFNGIALTVLLTGLVLLATRPPPPREYHRASP